MTYNVRKIRIIIKKDMQLKKRSLTINIRRDSHMQKLTLIIAPVKRRRMEFSTVYSDEDALTLHQNILYNVLKLYCNC